MSEARQTLLPTSASPLVQAMDALEERLFCLPFDAIAKSPHTVPVQLLDHLAWELSMDVWDPVWPEDVKRQILADAEELHQYKGTPHGIKLALAALGASARIEEWWEDSFDGEPGTFRVTAFADRRLYDNAEFIIDSETFFVLRSMVYAFAPVSRGVSFRMGVAGRAAAGVGAAGVPLHRAVRKIAPFQSVLAAGGALVTTGTTTRARLVRAVHPKVIATGAGEAFMQSGATARHRLKLGSETQ